MTSVDISRRRRTPLVVTWMLLLLLLLLHPGRFMVMLFVHASVSYLVAGSSHTQTADPSDWRCYAATGNRMAFI